MKVIIEIEGTPKENDLLILKDGKYVPIPKNVLLSEIYANLESLKQDLANYKVEVENSKKAINERLKEHHDVLKILTKGE